MIPHGLPEGIIAVLQTPFHVTGEIDWDSYKRLIDDAVDKGVNGFLAPAVAGEVDYLKRDEREKICRFVRNAVKGRASFILGASAQDAQTCIAFADLASQIKADAYLVAVPDRLYGTPHSILSYFQTIAQHSPLPLIIQDLRWHDDGLSVEIFDALKSNLPTFSGVKIETIPAGPKYSTLRNALGEDFFICGGWAIQQMIEAMDRGVDALLPEGSMVRVYKTIWNLHHQNQREQAKQLFYRLLPVLSFTNQEITLSIAFFKRLLVKRGVIRSEFMRRPGFQWDAYNRRMADELIMLYTDLEQECRDFHVDSGEK
ncbi:MAG: dihydrodipicolinate synthase family protein [Candidatus Omnitrophica bacterium]|nr:dihydrodipicolinate synthase family protein [Candidatus Omnitrophota bacterium]